MRSQKSAHRALLHDGTVVCCSCINQTDAIDRELLEGDTYCDDACDRCKRVSFNEIAELGDRIVSDGTEMKVFVNESNLQYAKFLIREGKYWSIAEKGQLRQ